MFNKVNFKNNKRLIALVCTSFGCLLIFSIILLMVHFNVFPKSNLTNEEFVDIQFTAEEVITSQETAVFKNRNLSQLLNKLPSRQREAIFLKYYSGLKAKEISEIMGINYQSVINTLFKAIKSLKEEISILKLFN